MKMKRMYLSVTFKAILCIAALSGILIQVRIFSGAPNWSVLNYFTLISNLLCAAYFLAAAVNEAKGGRAPLPMFRGAVVLGISITGLVYHFLLSGAASEPGAGALANILLHYAVPLMAMADWLLFAHKGHYRFSSPFLWLLLPDGYFVYAVIRVALGANLGYAGNRYPYPFLNVDALGWGQVLLYGLILNLLFLLVGFLFVLIDRLMARGGKQ